MALTFIRIEHYVKFETIKDATREADTLRMNIARYAKSHNIPCTAMIGISTTNLRNAEVVLIKNGKFRPKRKIVSKVKRAGLPEQIEPHLHIVLICKSKYVELSKYLITKIQNRYQSFHPNWDNQEIYEKDDEIAGINYAASYYSLNDPLYYIKYVVRQSSSIRYVEDYTGEIDFDFKGQVRLNLKVVNEHTYFHKKMRKNYIEPSEKYHQEYLSKIRSISNKLAYLKRDNKPITVCKAHLPDVTPKSRNMPDFYTDNGSVF